MSMTIERDDLIQLLRLANRTECPKTVEDIRMFSRMCQALLESGMAPDEIAMQIAPLPMRTTVQP